MSSIYRDEDKNLYYQGDTFKITLIRYSDPQRLNLARNAAIYLGKSDRDNIKRPLGIVRKGHVPEIFRGEYAEFIFEGVSKEVYDHLVTYTTRNMRAAGGNRALKSDDFTIPSDKVKSESHVREQIEMSMNNYGELLQSGETRQVARSAMPVAAKMNTFVYQFNFLTLGESLFKQRIWEKGAQGNTVKVVQGMFELCRTVDYELWETFYEYKGTPAVEWEEVRKRLNKKGFTLDDLISTIDNDTATSLDVKLVDYLVNLFGEQKSMW